jgi:hypothetical protein
MTLVKGIIITFGINEDRKAVGRVVLSETTTATAIEYEVKEHLLYIKFYIEAREGLNKGKEGGDPASTLVSRKEFLDSVFVSAQFLTDYFILKPRLNSECLAISTSLSKTLNSTVHFHIEYSGLYEYVEQLKRDSSIKEIDSFLSRLKHYLHSNMERTITHYLSSQDLANQHQVMLMNKCEAINRDISL